MYTLLFLHLITLRHITLSRTALNELSIRRTDLYLAMNATEELKRISRNCFQERFQQVYSRWQKCIVAERYCLEGNMAEVIVLYCISQNILKLPRIRRLSFTVTILSRSILSTLVHRGMAGWLICFHTQDAIYVASDTQYLPRHRIRKYMANVIFKVLK